MPDLNPFSPRFRLSNTKKLRKLPAVFRKRGGFYLSASEFKARFPRCKPMGKD